MIDHKEPRIPFSCVKINRYPDNILLINQGSRGIGQITIKDDFEEELWKEAINKINLLQNERQN